MITAIAVLGMQQNFELEVGEIEELKDLRLELISMALDYAHCYPTAELIDSVDADCLENFSQQKMDPLVLASRIRMTLFKKLYLFDEIIKEQLNFSDTHRPFTEGSVPSMEMDPHEFLYYYNDVLDAVDVEIDQRRTNLRGWIYR